MDSIQSQSFMVVSLQLASGRLQTGRQIQREIPRRIHVQVSRQAGVPSPLPIPPPDGQVVSQGQQSAPPDTLEALGVSGQQYMFLCALPELFTFLEDRPGMSPRSYLEQLATLPLTEWTLLLI